MAASKAIIDTDAPLETRQRIIEHFRHEADFDQDIKEKWWQLLDDGHTLGIFQIEQGAKAIDLAQQIRPRSVDDLAVLVGLNRPGPLRSGDTNRYINRRRGEEPVTYPHDILAEILEPTLGVFVFQEQVIAYFSKIGYPLTEADHIRKILGKKLVKEMEAEFPRYRERAENFMSVAQAKAIWELIVNYSKYGFNKAHAVAYATISAWTIYAKGRWPVEFYMASIEKNAKKVGLYVAEARRRGIQVLPPNVNDSGVLIGKTTQDGIIYGLADIKGVKSAAVSIVANQPYSSPEDFIDRSGINAGVKKLISRAGALDAFGYRLVTCETCEGKGRVPQMVPKKNGDGLKRVLIDCEGCHQGWARAELPGKAEIIAAEQELLEIVLTDVTSEIVEKYQDRLGELESLAVLNEKPEGIVVTVPAVITSIAPGKIKNGPNAGQPFGNITLEWKGVDQRVVVWTKEWKGYDFAWKPFTVGEFTLKAGTGRNGNWGVTMQKAKVWFADEPVPTQQGE